MPDIKGCGLGVSKIILKQLATVHIYYIHLSSVNLIPQQ